MTRERERERDLVLVVGFGILYNFGLTTSLSGGSRVATRDRRLPQRSWQNPRKKRWRIREWRPWKRQLCTYKATAKRWFSHSPIPALLLSNRPVAASFQSAYLPPLLGLLSLCKSDRSSEWVYQLRYPTP
jgi:hypothetical protein